MAARITSIKDLFHLKSRATSQPGFSRDPPLFINRKKHWQEDCGNLHISLLTGLTLPLTREKTTKTTMHQAALLLNLKMKDKMHIINYRNLHEFINCLAAGQGEGGMSTLLLTGLTTWHYCLAAGSDNLNRLSIHTTRMKCDVARQKHLALWVE